MVLISNKSEKLTRLDETFVPFTLFIAIKFIRVLITKTALTKLLENTLDGGSGLRGMSDEGLGCPAKLLLSQSFCWTMSNLSGALILHPALKYVTVPFYFLETNFALFHSSELFNNVKHTLRFIFNCG